MSNLSETALVAALAVLAVAAAMVSWGSWLMFLRTRKLKYRGQHRTRARPPRQQSTDRTTTRTR